MKTFKQYLEEKTFAIDKDVDIIYDRLFKEIINNIKTNAGNAISQTIKQLDSNELVSASARKANVINPVTIVGGLDLINPIANYYSPNDKTIHLSIHPGAALMLRNNIGKSIKDLSETIPSHQRRNFISEFTSNKIKSSIQHELSHWLDDTLHNSHITNTIKKASDANINTTNKRDRILNRGMGTSLVTDYEINAQIHAIKQLKRNNHRIWDKLSIIDMITLSPSLSHIYRSITDSQKSYWIRKLLHRMNRENLLGNYMKKPNENI